MGVVLDETTGVVIEGARLQTEDHSLGLRSQIFLAGSRDEVNLAGR